jgi:hypothetical protein
VIATIEIVLGEPVGDLVQRVGRQHQAAEHRLLGFDRVRRHTQRLDLGVMAALAFRNQCHRL